MVSLGELKQQFDRDPLRQYRCNADLHLFDCPQLVQLATQAAQGRYLRILAVPSESPHGEPLQWGTGDAIPVCLCEDDYPGWIRRDDLQQLVPAAESYRATVWSGAEIGDRLPAIMAYTQAAMAQPNYYLWGGTIGPSYDCSGLVQAAFRSVGIWIPRDAYLQEPFTQPVSLDTMQPGDLIFFGPRERANHVALYLGDRHYIHSSGTAIGRNGIGIDSLVLPGETPSAVTPISQAYGQQIHGVGRVVSSYQPTGIPMRTLNPPLDLPLDQRQRGNGAIAPPTQAGH